MSSENLKRVLFEESSSDWSFDSEEQFIIFLILWLITINNKSFLLWKPVCAPSISEISVRDRRFVIPPYGIRLHFAPTRSKTLPVHQPLLLSSFSRQKAKDGPVNSDTQTRQTR